MHNAHPHALNNNHPEATFALGIEANLPERSENKMCPGTLKERNNKGHRTHDKGQITINSERRTKNAEQMMNTKNF